MCTASKIIIYRKTEEEERKWWMLKWNLLPHESAVVSCLDVMITNDRRHSLPSFRLDYSVKQYRKGMPYSLFYFEMMFRDAIVQILVLSTELITLEQFS